MTASTGPTLSHDTVLARSPGALWRRCIDGVLVLADGADDPVLLKAPGDAVWELLSAPAELGQLLGELGRRFAGTAEQIEIDTTAFLRDAIAAGAVEMR